jgi:hypothetical protein
MAEHAPAAKINLSGYLPGREHNGLTDKADDYVARFEQAYAEADGNPELILVVGLLKVASVQHRSNPDENPPTVALRFAHVEPVTTEANQKTMRKLLRDLTAKRTGVEALPLEGLQ